MTGLDNSLTCQRLGRRAERGETCHEMAWKESSLVEAWSTGKKREDLIKKLKNGALEWANLWRRGADWMGVLRLESRI